MREIRSIRDADFIKADVYDPPVHDFFADPLVHDFIEAAVDDAAPAAVDDAAPVHDFIEAAVSAVADAPEDAEPTTADYLRWKALRRDVIQYMVPAWMNSDHESLCFAVALDNLQKNLSAASSAVVATQLRQDTELFERGGIKPEDVVNYDFSLPETPKAEFMDIEDIMEYVSHMHTYVLNIHIRYLFYNRYAEQVTSYGVAFLEASGMPSLEMELLQTEFEATLAATKATLAATKAATQAEVAASEALLTVPLPLSGQKRHREPDAYEIPADVQADADWLVLRAQLVDIHVRFEILSTEIHRLRHLATSNATEAAAAQAAVGDRTRDFDVLVEKSDDLIRRFRRELTASEMAEIERETRIRVGNMRRIEQARAAVPDPVATSAAGELCLTCASFAVSGASLTVCTQCSCRIF